MSSTNENPKTQPAGGTVNPPPSGLGAPAPLTPSESLAEFQAAHQRYIDELQPRGVVEQTLVFQLAATAWRLRRLPYLESVLVATLLHRPASWKELDLISRHETRLSQTHQRTLREFESRRRVPPPPPEPKADTQPSRAPEAAPPPADFSYQAAAAQEPSQAPHPAAAHTPSQAASPPV